MEMIASQHTFLWQLYGRWFTLWPKGHKFPFQRAKRQAKVSLFQVLGFLRFFLFGNSICRPEGNRRHFAFVVRRLPFYCDFRKVFVPSCLRICGHCSQLKWKLCSDIEL